MAQKNLHVLMTADAKGVESTLQRVEAGFSKLTNQTAGLRAGLGAIVGGANPLDILKGQVENLVGDIPKIGPALQAGLGIAESFWGKLRETQKDVAEQGKHALGLGATIEGYSKLRFAVSDAEALDKGLHHLNVSVAEAAMGNEEAGATFKRLGLDVEQLIAMPAEKRFLAFADALKHVENGALRSHEAQKILGKGALNLMGDLMKGGAGLEKIGAVGVEHGKVITTQDVANAQLINAQFKLLNTEFDAMWRSLATGLAPVMASILQDVRGLTGETGKLEISDKFKADLIEMKYGFTDALHVAKALFLGGTLFDFTAAKKELDKIVGPTKARELAEQQVAKWKAEAAGKAAELADREKQSLVTMTEKLKKEREDAELKKQQAEFERIASKIKESSLTPWDKFQNEVANINSAAEAGALSWDQYYGGLAAVVAQFEKLNKVKNEYRATEALEYGSTGEASARFQSRFASDQGAASSNDRMLETLTQMREDARQSKEANKKTAQLLESALAKLGVASIP